MIEYQRNQNGFTLIELAIVLLVVGLLTRSFISPIASSMGHQRFLESELTLQAIKESVLAYVVSKGGLPCPIDSNVGMRDFQAERAVRICDVSQGGVPAARLGIAGAVDEHGALLDPWGRRFLYVVSLDSHPTEGDRSLPDWTTVGEASYVGISNLNSSLTMCSQASSTRCPFRYVRADQLAFVVLSQGQRMQGSSLERENTDNDDTFVVAEHSLQKDSTYDDQVVWSSIQEVMYWMLRAAWLP